MRIGEGLGGLVHRTGRDARFLQVANGFLRGAFGAPACHAFADLRTVPATALVAGESLVGQPVRLAHQRRPALEQRVAHHHGDDSAIPGLENVVGRAVKAPVAVRPAIELQHGFFHQQAVVQRQRG